MIVITVARKPVIGTVADNVLKYGTGGLNIDACRIASTDAIPTFTSTETNRFRDPAEDMKIARTGETRSNGRWPANLMFQHKPGCKHIGTQSVKGNRTDTRPEGDGGTRGQEPMAVQAHRGDQTGLFRGRRN